MAVQMPRTHKLHSGTPVEEVLLRIVVREPQQPVPRRQLQHVGGDGGARPHEQHARLTAPHGRVPAVAKQCVGAHIHTKCFYARHTTWR